MERQHGQGVRIQDISLAAGVSRQAVYLHFPSRAELLVATTHYADQVLGGSERFQRYCDADGGIEKLEAYLDFWLNYIPEIYGLAKALMIAQETDEAAAAAWKARMNDVYEGCHAVISQLQQDQLLAEDWTPTGATSLMWSMLQIPNWENMILTRGWTQEQYVSRMKIAMKKLFVKSP
jgi:AcrR family transcriptional regulator